jgi:hydrogenase maturation protease
VATGVGGTLVVGVGNDDRGDDGVGPLVARLLGCALADDPPPGVAVLPWTGAPLGLLDVWEGWDRLVLIDAMVSGGPPGACRRWGADAPFRTDAGRSTHGFGLASTLALARTLDRAPATVEVWGIEGAAFEPGAPLTPAVACAALALVERLGRELRAGGARTPPTRPTEDVLHS